MTILDALAWGEAQIKERATDKVTRGHNAKLDAQVLLSFCLKKPTAFLFAHVDEPVESRTFDQYARLIERRKRHEPIAYILGKKPFYSRPFNVNPAVLIPRPETEMLVDLIKESATDNTSIIDVGTGSGAIAVTLAAELNIPVVAIDASQDALAVAKHNAQTHNASGHIAFMQGNLLEPYIKTNSKPLDGKVIIVANLPYISIGSWQTLDPDVKQYEPKLALVGGVDGLDLYDELLSQIQHHRNAFPGELELYMEIDPSQELSLPRLVREHFSKAPIELIEDLSGKPRVVFAKL